MPELPEIETLKRTLSPRILGARVERVRVFRADVITRLEHGSETRATELLQGDTIVELRRHGKQLAIVGESGRVICFHLGMSGQVRVVEEPPSTSRRPPGVGGAGSALSSPRLRLPMDLAKHVHVMWTLKQRDHRRDACATRFFMLFRDPRRFGGIWTAPDLDTLFTQRWRELGPDALAVTPAHLGRALAGTTRAVKAALLDQSILAGVGNIYADEALFMAGIHPLRRSDRLSPGEIEQLADSIRRVLRAAIRGRGSTLRDYVNADGEAGRFARSHAVYGRAGEACTSCGRTLAGKRIAQRATVFCARCQPRKVRVSVIHT